MTIAASLLPEFDQEMASTRRVLERVPEDKFAWKPHPKSTALGDLASHVAQLSGFPFAIVSQPKIDFATAGFKQFKATTQKELLEQFDQNVAAARKAIEAASDQEMMTTWSLSAGDQVFINQPRVDVIRLMALNHVIHHRGQLSVYLRLNGALVPSIYGPSADEAAM